MPGTPSATTTSAATGSRTRCARASSCAFSGSSVRAWAVRASDIVAACAPGNARALRASLKHPIVDADGHWIEYIPVMREEFKRIGGEAAVEGLTLEAAAAKYPELAKSVAKFGKGGSGGAG